MQQSLKAFDGIGPIYNTEDFLKNITANMALTAVPEQIASPYYEA